MAHPPAASIFAAAASVAKARCEIDFSATTQAASELAFRGEMDAGDGERRFLRPIESVGKLIKQVAKNIWQSTRRQFGSLLGMVTSLVRSDPQPPLRGAGA